jgi:hypothetical protein
MVITRRTRRPGRASESALALAGSLPAMLAGLMLVGCADDGGGEAMSATDGATDPSADDSGSSDGTGDSGPTPSDDDTGTTGDDGPTVDVNAPPGGLRRLLSHQYVASLELLLGPAAAAAAVPPDDPEVGTFDAFATIDSIPGVPDIESYEQAAASAADAAIEDKTVLAQHAPCVSAAAPEASCYAQVAEELGRLAWRRPLDADQIDRLVTVAEGAQVWGEGDFDAGLRYLLMAILQSPRFLYLVEVGVPGVDGEPRELDGYEMASRLSFFLLGRTPDAPTLALAESGELDTDEGVRTLAESMVSSPAAMPTIQRFFGEYLRIRELPTKGKSEELFPLFSPELAQSMMDETSLLVSDIVFQKNTNMLELFTADYTFVDANLAELYGVTAPEGGAFAKTMLPPEQKRAGILSQPGWLAMQSHTDVNSPTRRGLFIVEQMFCTDIPNPPAEVDAQPLQPEPGQTLREALEVHMTEPACATCHVFTDPLGFAFENYDPIGQFRTTEAGQPVDATGEIEGAGAFDGAAELMALVTADERVPGCLLRNVYMQGLGFVPGPEVEPALDDIELGFAEADYRMKRMLVELASSPLFRQVGEPK